MRRERKTLCSVWDPVLPHWTNLCRAPTKKSGRRNRAYGAEFIVALSYSLCRHLAGDIKGLCCCEAKRTRL
jgi:hypothetical protein